MKPKGLRLMRDGADFRLEEAERVWLGSPTVFLEATNEGGWFDADQLDKLAERCKQWSKYLRSQKGKKPVPPKKWEDL